MVSYEYFIKDLVLGPTASWLLISVQNTNLFSCKEVVIIAAFILASGMKVGTIDGELLLSLEEAKDGTRN